MVVQIVRMGFLNALEMVIQRITPIYTYLTKMTPTTMNTTVAYFQQMLGRIIILRAEKENHIRNVYNIITGLTEQVVR